MRPSDPYLRLNMHEVARLAAETALPPVALAALAERGVELTVDSLAGGDVSRFIEVLRAAERDGQVPPLSEDAYGDFRARLLRLHDHRAPLSRLAARLGIRDRALLAALKKHGVNTLEDLRTCGGIRAVLDATIVRGNAAAACLDAHVRLSMLPTDVETNQRFIEAGLDGVGAIASQPREQFVADWGSRLGPARGTTIHTAAGVLSDWVSNRTAALLVGNAVATAAVSAALTAVDQSRCHCDECHDAAGPLAYLVDLIEFASRHLRYQGAPVTAASLQDVFKQPFDDLAATCQSVTGAVRQVRIAVEVLRAVLGAPLTAPSWYRESAHDGLLRELGTSVDEVRRARRWKQPDRELLLTRLGLPIVPARALPGNPDGLDLLLLDPDLTTPPAPVWPLKLTEDSLERLFGLRDTNRPPTDPDPDPEILLWRLATMRQTWFEQDWPTNPPSDALPIVDPDVIDLFDIPSGSAAEALWMARADFQLRELAEMRRVRAAAGLEGLLSGQSGGAPVYANAMGRTPQGFRDLRRRRDENGEDISNELTYYWQLSASEFEGILAVIDAEALGMVLDAEWEDLYAILLARLQRQLRATWRDAERNARITLSQDDFQPRDTGGNAAFVWTPKPRRSDPETRRLWERTLQQRIEQERTIRSTVAQMVDRVEGRLLVGLRDVLVDALTSPASPAKRSALARRLQIELQMSDCQKTTRLAQAIHTLQGVLFGARNGLLVDDSFQLLYDRFDEEWRWMGSYATWRAVMLVFLYPENTLRPTLRAQRSKAFDALVDDCRLLGASMTAADADRLAATYSSYFADVCSLEPVAVYAAGDWGQGGLGGAVIVARSASGLTYFAFFRQFPYSGATVVPDHTFWEAIPDLPAGATIVGVMPSQVEQGTVAVSLFARVPPAAGQQPTYWVTTFDGARWTSSSTDTLPVLATTTLLAEDGIQSPAAVGGAAAWTLRGTDRLIPLLVEGTGSRQRPAVILVARDLDPAGNRPIGLLRWSDGGLVMTRMATVPGGWDLPSQGVVRVDDGGVQRVLMTRSNAGVPELALLGIRWPGDGIFTLTGITNGGVVATSTGQTGWQINLGTRTSGGVTRQFLGVAVMDLDQDGRSDLIAIERIEESITTVPFIRTSLALQRIRVGNGTLTHVAAFDVLPDQPANIDSFGWEALRFTDRYPTPFRAVRLATGPALVTVARRVYYVSGQPTELMDRGWFAVIRWANAQFSPVEISLAEIPVPTPGDPQGNREWTWFDTDRLQAVRLADGTDRLLLTRTGANDTALLRIGAPNVFPPVTATWFGTVIPRASDAVMGDWVRQPDDIFTPVRVRTDDAEELLVCGDGLALLEITSAGMLRGSWLSPTRTRVSWPHSETLAGWNHEPGVQYAAMDLDGDRRDEIVGLTPSGTLGLLHGFPRAQSLSAPLATLRIVRPWMVATRSVVRRWSAEWAGNRASQIQDAYTRNTSPSIQRYLDEAFYFVPIELALRLQAAGQHQEVLDWLRSVYDYDAPAASRAIAYKLVLEAGDPTFQRTLGWFEDPLNPHTIAVTRKGTYTAYTILTLVRCLLAYADAEFTRATAESLRRASALYSAALDLLDDPLLKPRASVCQEILSALAEDNGEAEVALLYRTAARSLERITTVPRLLKAAEEMAAVFTSRGSVVERRSAVQAIGNEAAQQEPRLSIGGAVARVRAAGDAVGAALVGDAPNIAIVDWGRTEQPGDWIVLEGGARIDPRNRDGYVPRPALVWCLAPNPVFEALRLHAGAALAKILSCRNIAGMEFHPDPLPGQAATAGLGDEEDSWAERSTALQPIPYHYATIVERAKQLVELARQMEESMLRFLTAEEQERYQETRARHDVTLARAGARLRDLQVYYAQGSVGAAELQRDRARRQAHHYFSLLDGGMLATEHLQMAALAATATLYTGAAIAKSSSVSSFLDWWSGAASETAQATSTTAQIFGAYAGFERRRQEWQQSWIAAEYDARIGSQQVALAQDQVRISEQERTISLLQVSQAESVLDFLVSKRFFNSDLYDWMSGVIEGIYRFFLQQAIAMARLAEQQLAFERQEPLPRFIAADYWEPPAQGQSPDLQLPSVNGQPANLHGLTGSARLLRDLYQLDTYAFTTNQRKLQMTETISLAQLDPVAFEVFRTTGVLYFRTSSELFDRKFPGHYLRLIRRVRVSVVALVPPAHGVRATLASVGHSRVVTGPPRFEDTVVRRPPQSVALTTALNATGVFELDPQSDLLAPFEGMGVDATWTLDMPKAANRFDYRTMADVLFTIEYTAMASADYREAVVRRLPRQFNGDRAYSFRQEFADAWYDLNNPELVAPSQQMIVSVDSTLADFPANLDAASFALLHVSLYVTQKDGAQAPFTVESLSFLPPAGGAIPADPVLNPTRADTDAFGLVSTRRGQWLPFVTTPQPLPVTGTWTIALPNDSQTRARFKDGLVTDLLFVLSYSAELPPWTG